jgi:hypothetical protein
MSNSGIHVIMAVALRLPCQGQISLTVEFHRHLNLLLTV